MWIEVKNVASKKRLSWTVNYLDIGDNINKDIEETVTEEVKNYLKSLDEQSEITNIENVENLKKTAKQLIIECDNWIKDL